MDDKTLSGPSNGNNNSASCLSCDAPDDSVPYLTEKKILYLIEHKNYNKLATSLHVVFSSMQYVLRSFRKPSVADSDGAAKLMELDYRSMQRAYKALFKLPHMYFETLFVKALSAITRTLQIELQTRNQNLYSDAEIIHIILVLFAIPALDTGGFLETAFPLMCNAVKWLSIDVQARLAREWACQGATTLRGIVRNINRLLEHRVIISQFKPRHYMQEEFMVIGPTIVLGILYYANMLTTPESRVLDEELFSLSNNRPPVTIPIQELATLLRVHVLDCKKTYIAFQEFYSHALSDIIDIDLDYNNYRGHLFKFSFMRYPFVLTPAAKSAGLYYDNKIRKLAERRLTYVRNATSNSEFSMTFNLIIRRDHIIQDTMDAIELNSMDNPSELHKKLVVRFDGELGIDEGGVSKEFFQLVVDEIFNIDYGLFIFQNDSQTMWFNTSSFDNDNQYKMIGIFLGLAIYNNIILAINFPLVLYRKLMGLEGTFEDLADWNPTLFNSLKQLLEYEDSDVYDVFMQTFRVDSMDAFGNVQHHDLIVNGDETKVTQSNKHEFVKMYADYLLNKSVETKFEALYEGFRIMLEDSPVSVMFRPEELEILICGSKVFDIYALESGTRYESGYTDKTPIIRDFWSVVREFSLNEQRKLLQFTTGSDRVPIGGLSRLRMRIVRNGPDTDRLPTSHTCYNILLLPEYDGREKLKNRLLKAITYSKGFGLS